MVNYRKRKMKKDRTRMEEMILLFVLLSFFLRIAALLIVPGPSKPQMDTSILADVIGTVDRFLLPVHKSGERAGRGADLWEGSLAQKIRDEVVLTKLSEMGLSEELKPPLPRVSLFPPGKLEEQEKKMILENSRFYHELGENVQGKEREKEILDVSGPKTSDARGGTIPLPEDTEAQQIIASLREAAKEEEAGKKSSEAAALNIRGPAAGRKVSYLPPPLPSKPPADGDCLLKFWIFPDGTVGKIVPLVKGDTQAAAVAIDRIKKLRFEPLPKGVPQVEQWGMITAKSALR
jgi:hypothetical protein